MTYTLGVDIGTSYTAAAIWRDGRTSTVTLADRADSIPSAVFLKADGGLLVGDAAMRRGVLEPDRLARGFKRSLGDPTKLLLGDETMTRTELTGQLLRFVLAKVVAREGGPPSHVTLTVPANWGEHHRGLMTQVAAEAGLTDVGLLPEPVAVAIHYAAQERIELGSTIAVYDLGGGTFDAALVQRTNDGYELRGQPGGDESIGGEDFDDVVMNQVRRNLGNALTLLDMSDEAVLAGLQQVRLNAIAAKEALSADVESSITVILPGITREIRLTRAEFQGAIRIALLRTVDALDRTIAAAGMRPAELSAVLLAGGSAQIPLVSQLLAEELGVQVVTDAHPKYSVCLGAALAAASRAAVAAPALVLESVAADTAALLAPTGPPEVVVSAVPGDIGLAQPADVAMRVAPGLRRRLRYLSDRDELVVEVHGNARRGSKALLLAVALVGVLLAGVVFGATRGWFRGSDGPPVITTTPSAAVDSIIPTAEAPPVALTPIPIAAAAGETAWAVADSSFGLVAVGGVADPVGPQVWTSDGQSWAPSASLPQLQGRVGQLDGLVVGAGNQLIAVGWSSDLSQIADPKQRRGELWISPDGKHWGRATLPDIGEIRDIVRLPSGSLVAAGQSYMADPSEGDAVVLTSTDGKAWQRVAGTGLDGPGPFELRRLVVDPAGGLIGLGSRLDGPVQRSGLWRSVDGVAWTFDKWLPAVGPGVADGWGMTLSGDGSLVVVGTEAGGPVVWRTEAGQLIPYPVTGADGAQLLGVTQGPSGLVIVGSMGGAAGVWTMAG